MCLIKEKNMKHSFSKIYVGAIALLIGVWGTERNVY